MESLPNFDTAIDTLSAWGTSVTDTVSVWAQSAYTTVGEWLAIAAGAGDGALASAMMLDVPVPDAALLLASALVVAATFLIARRSKNEVRGEIDDLYQAELLQANRRTYQAKAELKKANTLIERERQKRRREATRNNPKARRAAPQLVEPVAKTA